MTCDQCVMLHEDGHPDYTVLPCGECPFSLSDEGMALLSVFNRAASYELYQKDGRERAHVTVDWPLVSLLLEEDDDRTRRIHDLADLTHALNAKS